MRKKLRSSKDGARLQLRRFSGNPPGFFVNHSTAPSAPFHQRLSRLMAAVDCPLLVTLFSTTMEVSAEHYQFILELDLDHGSIMKVLSLSLFIAMKTARLALHRPLGALVVEQGQGQDVQARERPEERQKEKGPARAGNVSVDMQGASARCNRSALALVQRSSSILFWARWLRRLPSFSLSFLSVSLVHFLRVATLCCDVAASGL